MPAAQVALATITLGSSASSECIQFQGHIQETGYGVKRRNGLTYKAHRLAYMDAFGEIPKGLIIDHMCHTEAIKQGLCEGGWTCKHRACINPEHLQAITSGENNRQGLNGLENRSHCKKGHDLSVVGIVEFTAQRKCAGCNREATIKAKRAWRARQKELAAA